MALISTLDDLICMVDQAEIANDIEYYPILSYPIECIKNNIDIEYNTFALPTTLTTGCLESDSNLVYYSCPRTNEECIYIVLSGEDGLEIHQYSMWTDQWVKIFTSHIQHSNISNAVDALRNTLYIVAKIGAKYSSHSLDTMLYVFNLQTQKMIRKTVIQKNNMINLADMCNMLSYIPSPIDELHLLYSSFMNHTVMTITQDNYLNFKGHNGINIAYAFNNRARLRFAKSIHVPCLNRIFVFGAKAPRLQLNPNTDADASAREIYTTVKKGRACTDKRKVEETQIKSKRKYCLQNAVPHSIWFCDINQKGQKECNWNIYKQRLPHKTHNFGVLNGFDYLLFLVYHTTNESIWCLDLFTGDLVKCNGVFPFMCYTRMHMVSTEDNYGHFMIMNGDYAWVRRLIPDFDYYYANELTGQVTVQAEPDFWHEHEKEINAFNFHIRIDLLDFVPNVIKTRHKQRYFVMIQTLALQNINHFATELVHLISMYTTRLCHCCQTVA
eukprot:301084_1